MRRFEAFLLYLKENVWVCGWRKTYKIFTISKKNFSRNGLTIPPQSYSQDMRWFEALLLYGFVVGRIMSCWIEYRVVVLFIQL